MEKDTMQMNIYKTIRERILNGKYESNTKLVEKTIAEEFDVSRTPVREAMKRLEQENLIKNKRIIKHTETDIRHMFEVRSLIEAHASEKAAKFMLKEKKILLNDSILKARKAQTIEEVIYQNKRFHDLIVDELHNPIMVETVEHMQSIIYMFSKAIVLHEKPSLLEEHEKIYNAIVQRNPSKAKAAMEDHLKSDLEFALNIVI